MNNNKTLTVTGADTLKYLVGEAATDVMFTGGEKMQVSDGYHSMDDLYGHRIALFIALCRVLASIATEKMSPNPIWRSQKHSDGTMFAGWFVMGAGKEQKEQITYHLPMSEWGKTEFATTLEAAPMWDGHTSEDVLDRIYRLSL